MEVAKVTSKGQITIPKEVRLKLNLQTGSKVVFLNRGSEWVLTNLESPAEDSGREYRLLTQSERNTRLKELAAEYDAEPTPPETTSNETSSNQSANVTARLKKVQDAFEGFANEMGWESDQDIVDYVKALRRGEIE